MFRLTTLFVKMARRIVGEVRETYWGLLRIGFEAPHAANLTALVYGLRMGEHQEKAWTIEEVVQEVFWREMVRQKRVTP